MKKALAYVLAFVLVFSLNPFVYAADDSGYDFSEWTDDQMLYLFSEVETELNKRGLLKLEKSSPESSDSAEIISISDTELVQAYRDNEIAANRTYKGKTIEVTGVLFDLMSAGSNYVVYLSNSAYISCYFDKNHEDDLAKLKKGERVTIRGSIDWNLFENITMSNCEVVKQ